MRLPVTEAGGPAALPMGVKRPFTLASDADWVLAQQKQMPDMTLNALLLELRARGVTVSYYDMWHLVSRVGLRKNPVRHPAGSLRHSRLLRALA